MALSDQVQKAIATYIWGQDADASALSTAVSNIEYCEGGLDIILRKVPVVSVTEILIVSTSSTVTASTYDFHPEVGYVYKVSGASWAEYARPRNYKVTYTYGFSAIPDDIQLAIDTWVNYLTADSTGALSGYKTGDDSETYSAAVTIAGMPPTVRNLLSKYKRRLF